MRDAPPADVLMPPGTVVGSYRLGRKIARGGMGMVYEAAHVILPRRAAVKVMHPEMVEHPIATQRMLQEACILEAFSHPGVVRIYECGMLADRRPWLAMELIGGKPLSGHLACLGPLRVEELVKLLAAIVDVLAAAHRSGIVHRDLKPENVLILGPELSNLRLIDWGIALQPTLGPRLTLEDTTVGTPSYMAPEQVRGLRPDGLADVYALGVVAYEAATGWPPFIGGSGVEIALKHLTDRPVPLGILRPDLPEELALLIDRMLSKDPEARPTAAHVGSRLMVMTAAAVLAAEAAPYAELTVDDDDVLGEIDGVVSGEIEVHTGVRTMDSRSQMRPLRTAAT